MIDFDSDMCTQACMASLCCQSIALRSVTGMHCTMVASKQESRYANLLSLHRQYQRLAA